MNAKRIILLLAFSILISLSLTIVGLLNYELIRYADFWADRFGFPYWWVEHVLETFAGPKDYWHLEVANLVKNIILYFLLSFGSGFAILVFKQTKKRS
jgi:hypothetical protein